jgi:hypothetical protein
MRFDLPTFARKEAGASRNWHSLPISTISTPTLSNDFYIKVFLALLLSYGEVIISPARTSCEVRWVHNINFS